MNITGQLYEEHSEIKKMLHTIESICANYHKSLEFDQEQFSGVLDFLTVFVDQYHHIKEEKYLFSALENSGIQNQGGILEHIMMKHDLGRRYIRDIRIAHDGIVNKYHSVVKQLIDNCTAYTQHLFNHMEVEDMTIFPLAERVLSDESKEILSVHFKQVDREVFTPGKRDILEKTWLPLFKLFNPS